MGGPIWLIPLHAWCSFYVVFQHAVCIHYSIYFVQQSKCGSSIRNNYSHLDSCASLLSLAAIRRGTIVQKVPRTAVVLYESKFSGFKCHKFAKKTILPKFHNRRARMNYLHKARYKKNI